MNQPDWSKAIVDERKIVEYLLSEENSDGKYAFFVAFGFSVQEWQKLRNALLKHARENIAKQILETVHGTKYIIEGKLESPDGRFPYARSVWIIDKDKDSPRLVTAYALEGE